MAHLKAQIEALKAKADKKHGKDFDDLIALADQIEDAGEAAKAEKQAAREDARVEKQKAQAAEQAAADLRKQYEKPKPRFQRAVYIKRAV